MRASYRVLNLVLAALLAISLSAIPQAEAQTWPARPIRIVVPYPPGGVNDIISRNLAQKMSEQLRQQVLTDNRPGGGQVVGSEVVVQSAPDGYTVLLCSVTHAVNPSMVPKLPYDTLRDFTPVSFVGGSALVLVVPPSLPANSMREFIALLRSQPGRLNYASSGNGSGGHLAFELLKTMANLNITHVPYKGVSIATTDLLAGQVQALITNALAVAPLVKSGKLRMLGITGKARSPQFPDLPTFAESGVPGYESLAWFGVLGPRGMPRDVVLTMNGAIRQSLAAPDVRERFESGGLEAQGSTPEEFAAYIASEMTKWKTVVEKANIRPD